ncbi:MAG: hypothetical protein JKX98_09395 [Alcanivoracaceae bacterium]|nr:hypothetical protein [Alcanivoracaceae bacterium]
MNKTIIIAVLLMASMYTTISNAAAVGSGFNYQGELMDADVPANGTYVIGYRLFDAQFTGSAISGYISNNVTVVDGLFNIEDINFGDAVYDGNEIWLEIDVAPSAGSPDIETLPRQRLSAVPYAVQADFLAANGATNGDILKFNGNTWAAAAAPGASPWMINGSTIAYTNSTRVGIGAGSNLPQAALDIHAPANTDDLLRIQNGGGTQLRLLTDGELRIGGGMNIGTQGIVPTDGLKVKGDSHLSGKVGIGTITPQASLEITAPTNTDALIVKNNTFIKLMVHDNGGTSIGSSTSAPNNGLYLEGSVKQLNNSNGIMKYMLEATCANSGSSIVNSYNAVSSSPISISNGNSAGLCTITFPHDISARYFQATPVFFGSMAVSCRDTSSTKISCKRFNPSTLAGANGKIMILVY